MAGSLEELIAKLSDDLRDRVQERAAILWESGMNDDDATRRAYELETGKVIPKRVLAGLARAKDRSEEAPETKKKGGATG